MRYELAVEIARPPAEVYAYLADPTHLPDWQEDVEEVRDAPGGPLAGGRELHRGALVPGQARGVDARGDRRRAGHASSPCDGLGPVRVLDPPPARARRVTGHSSLVEAEADAGKLLGLGGPLLRKAAERRARGDFERLKAVLEAGA